MADDNLERITILLQARDRDFARAMDRNNKLIARLSRDGQRDTAQLERSVSARLDSMASSAMNFGRNFAAGLAGGAVAAAMGFLTTGLRQTVRSIAAVGDEARRAGLGVEEFQQWAFVADQNRIAVDSLVDAFKELNIRADEYIVTGAGGGAESFARLGFSAEDLAQRLEEPSELMLEIFNRLQRFGTADQIRIADEVFGGTGGERFVQLIQQGEDGLRRTMDRAREVGVVMEESMIQQAAEVDRRFTELTARLVRMGREIVVGWSYIAEDIADALTITDAEAQAEALRATHHDLATEARDAQHAIMGLAVAAQDAGYPQLAQVLANIATQMVSVADQFGRGEITAEGLRSVLGTLTGAAETAFGAMSSMDDISLENATAIINGLKARLAELRQEAAATAAQVAAATITPATQVGSFWDTEEPRFDMTRNAPGTSPRPRRAPALLGEPGTPQTGGGGGSAGGWAGAVADIEARTRALNLEAASFVAAAAGGHEYGMAAEFAAERARLMHEAMEAGRQITPALQAEIDALAESYITAAHSAEEARSALDRVRADAERGADAITSIFEAMTQGGDAARAAIARLLQQMASNLFQRALMGLSGGGGGFLSAIGGLLGKRAAGGPVQAGTPYLVNENTPNSEVFVPSRSGGILNVAQAKDALRGGAGGGALSVGIGFDASMGGFLAVVRDQTGRQIAQARSGIVGEAVRATHASFAEVRPQ